jgi:hypothetical protein
MAYEGMQIRFPGLESGEAALSASQFKFVQPSSTALRVILAATAGQQGVIGVIQDKPAAVGDPCLVCGGGVTKIVAGGAFAAGLRLQTDASGRAVSAAASATSYTLGYALEAALAAGDVVSMIFQKEGQSA